MTLDIKIFSYDANGTKTHTKGFSGIAIQESDVSGQRQLVTSYAALTDADTTGANLVKTTEIDLT